MRQLTLYILFSFIAISSLSSQDCEDKAVRYLDSQQELCGYHGGIKIPMNLPNDVSIDILLSADQFVSKWTEAISERRSASYEIQRGHARDYGKYSDIRYSLIDPNGIMQTVSMSVRIDAENNIRSYNVSCVQFDLMKDQSSNRKEKKTSDNNAKYQEKIFTAGDNRSNSKVDFGNALESNNSYSYTAPEGPESLCDPTNLVGFIGISESLSYINTSICELGDDDTYIDFQNNHNYVENASIGDSESLLEVRCIENSATKTRIRDKNGWVQSLNEVDGGYNHSDNDFVFCSQPSIDDIALLGMYEYTMTYYHLTKAFNYLTEYVIPTANAQSTSIDPPPFPSIPTDYSIRFDPFNTSLDGIYTVQKPNDILINFGAGDQSGLIRDLAEDDLYIVEAGFHAYWKYVLEDSPSDAEMLGNLPTDGLLFGAIDYMTWRYSGRTSLLTWGSNPAKYQREMTSPFNYSELLPNPTYQNRGQSFSNALFQISGVTSKAISDFLLYRTMPKMDIGTNQLDAAEMLYNEARMEYEDDNDGSNNENGISITLEDLCEIREILIAKYLDDIDLSEGLDYVIRDSYDGQPFNGNPQGQDIGLEPNTITSGFSKSPDIWNRKTSEHQNNKKHENPTYNGVVNNYLYVEVRTDVCNPPSMDGILHVYIRESHLLGKWPKDWTEGYYDNDPSLPLVGYEITHAEGNPLVSKGVSLSDYVYTYQETESNKHWNVYRYEIPWIPINPQSLPNNNGANAWACLLARIVSDDDPIDTEDDPIDTEEGSSAWTNNFNNNNIAIRNTSIHHVDGFTGGSDPTAEVLSSLNVISSYEDPPGGGGGTDDEEVEITFSVNPGPDLVNDEDIFDYIDIEFVMSQEFLDAWEPNGAEGDGFIRINTNTIRITDLNFSIKSILLPPSKHHRLFVRTRNKKEFDQLGFSVLLKNKEQCINGSQEYIVRGSEWDNIGNRSEGSNRGAPIPSIDLSPNPVQDMLFIQSNEFDIERLTIYSQKNEKMVLPIDQLDSRNVKIDVSNLNSGLYIIQIKTNNNIETRKFIKI